MGISSGIGSGLGLGFGLGFWGIAEAVSKKLNNSITKIQINGKYGTGFFMKKKEIFFVFIKIIKFYFN